MTQINTKNESNTQMFCPPHHEVYHEGSLTIQLRVVFEASAQSDTGLSLNDALRVDPILLRELFSILLSFREYNVLNTVTYGTSSTSFLAVGALHQAADYYVDRDPRTSQ
nr:unnamed protein product [Callosobruchus analis]